MKRRLFEMGPAWNSNPVDRVILNEQQVLRPGWQNRVPSARMFASQAWELGFWPMSEKPILRQVGRDKRKPVDLDPFRGAFWLISERCKSVFERVDSVAFSFVPCEHFTSDGTRSELWLCAVIRQVDALDEEASRVKIIQSPNWHRSYWRDQSCPLIFDERRVALHHHVFAMQYSLRTIIADDTMQKAVKAAGLRNIHFKEVICRPPTQRYIEPELGSDAKTSPTS